MNETSEPQFKLKYRKENGKILIQPQDLPKDCIIASKEGRKRLFSGDAATKCWNKKPDIMYRSTGTQWLVYKLHENSESLELRDGTLSLPHLYVEGKQL